MKLNKKPIIFLLGPTASGKTDWAIDWQNKFDAFEIISVDSVMVYKECNVGSAKPSKETLKHHPHHLVNHVSLDSIFSVANFYDAALELIDTIHNRDKIPLMVGGSMMYFNLLKTGMSSLPPADKLLREELESKILTDGAAKLHKDLKKLDPKVFNEMFGEEAINYDTDNIKTLTTELKNLVTSTNVSLFKDVKNDIKQIPELLVENETAPYILKPFFRCGILTEKALEAQKNGNSKKADTYAKLAIKSVVSEETILEKQGRQIKEKSIDPKSLENIEYSILGINSFILDDYKSGNRYIKKALESENQNTSNLKSLIAYTEIINGEIDQGCSDLQELISDGTNEIVDLDIFNQIEDICIKSRIIK